MPSVTTLGMFAAAALALLVVPGPAVLYVIGRSVDQGRKAGVVSVLGIGLGSMVHVAAAAVGVSALLASSASAFAIVKYLGAAYLVWLGVRTLRACTGLTRGDRNPCRGGARDETAAAAPQHPAVPLAHVFGQGALVQVLNPKTTLFFLAFLPQFVDPALGPAGAQVVLLGALFVLLALLSDGTYALLAGMLADWLRRSSSARRTLRYLSGGIYIGLGVTAAASGHRPGQQ